MSGQIETFGHHYFQVTAQQVLLLNCEPLVIRIRLSGRQNSIQQYSLCQWFQTEGGWMTRHTICLTILIMLVAVLPTPSMAGPCMKITLTGTQGGPLAFRGLAGSGTLVRYGDDTNDCSAVFLQFDTGRGTTQQLSKLRVPVGKLHAIFFTHLHSDHTEGLANMMQLRWHFRSEGPNVDVVCSRPARAAAGHTMDCRKFVGSIGYAFIQSGEMAQRLAENKKRRPGGPSDLVNVVEFAPTNEPKLVWSKGDVTVQAVKSRHVSGHASYRVNTPAGSVVRSKSVPGMSS